MKKLFRETLIKRAGKLIRVSLIIHQRNRKKAGVFKPALVYCQEKKGRVCG